MEYMFLFCQMEKEGKDNYERKENSADTSITDMFSDYFQERPNREVVWKVMPYR